MSDDFGFGPPRRRGLFDTRRRRRWLGRVGTIAIAVLVGVALVLAQDDTDTAADGDTLWGGGNWNLGRRMPWPDLPRPVPPPEPVAERPAAAPADEQGRPDDAFRLTVTYVYDGDTIEARVDEPNGAVATTAPIRIRLIGIDAPEGTPTPECGADEARTHLAQLLPEGTTVWAAPDTELRDRYDRWLFNLWTDEGRFVNVELVAAGHAESMRVWPNVGFDEQLADAEAEAAASDAGQWGTCG